MRDCKRNVQIETGRYPSIQNLKTNLEAEWYYQIENTTGLWKHKTNIITFALCVDDFGVNYFNQDDINHLISTLQKHYVITIEKSGKNFCGLTFEWNYKQKYIDVSMPDYVKNALKKYGHDPSKKPQYAPHVWASKYYGKQIILTPESENWIKWNDQNYSIFSHSWEMKCFRTSYLWSALVYVRNVS